MIHSWAWLAWLVATLVAISASRNPLYLLLIFLCLVILDANQRRLNAVGQTSDGLETRPFSPLRFALFVIPLSALINAAISHFGETVLLRLPTGLPYLGGAITLEALVYGAINGLMLSCIFAAFSVLNQALPVRALMRLIPRAFYPAAVVTSIAVTFVPATQRQMAQVREAQAIRGHRLRGLRDWLPLILPLLVSGLERAVGLAEAMTARGFASSEPSALDSRPRIWMLVGLLMLLGGWLLRLFERWSLLGNSLMMAGIALILITLWLVGKQTPRTIYRREAWTLGDVAVLLGAAVVLAAFWLPLAPLAPDSLSFQPYPALSLPGFDPLLGIVILCLLIPGLVASLKTAPREDQQ